MNENTGNMQLKAMAAHAAEQSNESLRQLYEEHTASFRWVMASYLALNGAGLLSLKDLKLAAQGYTLAAALSFFLGIVCAMAIAYIGQKAIQRMLGPVARISLYWRTVAVSGELNDAIQQENNELIENASTIGKWPARAGFASLAFFAVGLVIIGLGWFPA